MSKPALQYWFPDTRSFFISSLYYLPVSALSSTNALDVAAFPELVNVILGAVRRQPQAFGEFGSCYGRIFGDDCKYLMGSFWVVFG